MIPPSILLLVWYVDRQHLREGARLLVDPADQKTFQEVLDGTYVEPVPTPQTALGLLEGTYVFCVSTDHEIFWDYSIKIPLLCNS